MAMDSSSDSTYSSFDVDPSYPSPGEAKEKSKLKTLKAMYTNGWSERKEKTM